MVLRRLVSLIVSVWVCLVAALRLVLGRGKAAPEPAKVSWRRGGTPGGEGEGDQATWEDWDSFSVHVVPSDGEPRPPAPPLDGEEPAAHEVDLFQDMQPVIKKAKKIRVVSSPDHSSQLGADTGAHHFTIDSTFQPESADLEEWTEGGPSWEEETELGQGDLLRESQEALREQRKEERERRRLQQELLRNQRAQAAAHVGLGTRVNS